MRTRTAVLLCGLAAGTFVYAEEKLQTPPPIQEISQAQEVSLKQAPEEVQQKVLLHTSTQRLQSLMKTELGGQTIYEAVLEGGGANTRLQMLEDGSPLGLFVAGNAEAVDEAAGAPRPAAPPPAPATAQSGATTELPDAVKNALHQQLGEVQVQGVETMRLFDVTISNQGRQQQARIAEDGTLLGFEDQSAGAQNQQGTQAQPEQPAQNQGTP